MLFHYSSGTMINLLDPTVVITRMFESGKFDDMYNYCKKLLDNNPDDMVALQNSALALLYLERYEDSIIYCDKVLKIKFFDIYALKNKIYSLEKLKRYDEVISCCNVILDHESNDIWTLNSLGLSLNELDKHKEAMEFYDKTLKLDSKDVTALMNKAISLNHLKNYKESIEYYDKAQIVDPSLNEASIAKSQAFEKLGMEDEAFLAAQGVLVKDMLQIITEAKKNKCSVFHQYCQNEFEELTDKK
jgi:tetratricopeptide (TPR) repeat protein